jgi:hypothetical protein
MENTHGNIVNYIAMVLSFMAIQHFIVPRVPSHCNIEDHLATNDKVMPMEHTCGNMSEI